MQAPTFHVVNAIVPVADVEATSMDSDVINCQGAGVLFIYQTGANAGGDSTITIEACDDVTPSNTTTIPFVYRSCVATDVWGDWTAATTAGFTSSQVANAMHQIWVDGSELAEEGYGYVRFSGDEVTNASVTGGVIAIVMDPRYGPSTSTLLT